MSWFTKFLGSSIGQKMIMSLTGLFLILFLVVHLTGNLQLLIDDGGEQFNIYAKFMTSNPIIKFTSYGLYFFILLHAFQGIWLAIRNRQARGDNRYAVNVTKSANTSSFASKNMAQLGTIIFIFLLIHLYQFWFQMKIGALDMITTYAGYEEGVKNLYAPVALAFSNPLFVIFYVASMVVIAFHLWHGFQSAFQTLGVNHRKYTPIIHTVGKIYAVIIPLGFAIIPIYFYLFRNVN